MIKPLIIKQKKILLDLFKNKNEIKAIIILFVFLLLNAIKVTLFNYYMIPRQILPVLIYKFVITILLFLILYPLFFKIKSRVIFIMAYSLQMMYLLANLSYYLFFHDYLHPLQWITLLNEAFITVSHFASPRSRELLIAFIDLPVFIYIVINYFKINMVNTKLRFFRAAIAFLALCAILSIEIRNYNHNNSLIQYINDEFKGETPIVERYGTLVNNVVNYVRNVDEKALITGFKYGEQMMNSGNEQVKPNFFIIQVESMDAAVINQKYKNNYVVPFLHSLSEQSIYYPYVLSYHKGGGTADCEFSVINSVEPLDSFPALKLKKYTYPNSMLFRLKDASYYLAAFHGNVGDFYNRDVAFPKMGFDEFNDMSNMNLAESGWGIPDANVFDYALDKVKTVKQPFLGYVITMSSHKPFNSVRNYFNDSQYDDIKDETIKEYFNSMSYVDQSIRDFVTKIKVDIPNTYIFILGDHTPGINSSMYKQASFASDTKYFEFVPLFIITPDHKVYKEEKNVASFLDISPTILYTSGIPFKINSKGQSLIMQNGISKSIPYKGSEYSRSTLFECINKSMK